MNTERIVEAVANEYECTPAQIRGKCRQRPLPEARMMISFILKDFRPAVIGRVINRDRTSVIKYNRVMPDFIEMYDDVNQHYNNVLKDLELPCSMTIKLSTNQLQGIKTLIDFYLENVRPNNDAEGLIHDHMDDINEKIRRKLRAKSINLTLDPKQMKAFSIWYQNLPDSITDRCRFEQNTLLMMINQIRP